MIIRRPRGIKPLELAFFVGIGVIGGVYIWKPFFEQKFADKNLNKEAQEPSSKD